MEFEDNTNSSILYKWQRQQSYRTSTQFERGYLLQYLKPPRNRILPLRLLHNHAPDRSNMPLYKLAKLNRAKDYIHLLQISETLYYLLYKPPFLPRKASTKDSHDIPAIFHLIKSKNISLPRYIPHHPGFQLIMHLPSLGSVTLRKGKKKLLLMHNRVSPTSILSLVYPFLRETANNPNPQKASIAFLK